MRPSSLQFLAVLCLFLIACTLQVASAQSIWQKMKDAAKQQECQSGNQKPCQDLASLMAESN